MNTNIRIPTVIVMRNPKPNTLSAPFLLNFPISFEYKIGIPIENNVPKNTARECKGVTSVTPATASALITTPAINESDITIRDETIIASVPPNSIE